MPPTDTDLLREAMRHALAPPSGSPPGAWSRLSAVLIPVIGERGFEALFGRALHLTSVRYPWQTAKANLPLPAVIARLEARDPGAASEASDAVLATLAELLAILVGPVLCERLLAPMRAERAS